MYAIKVSVISALIGQVICDTDYKDNGDSWATIEENEPVCRKGWSQSPIDLDTKMRSTEEKFFNKHYENIIGDKDKRYTDPGNMKYVVGQSYFSESSSAVYVKLDNKDLGGANAPITQPTDTDNYHNANWFQSNKNLDFLEADPMYMAKQLHFHTKSEHTINGELKDLELHIVHQSPNKTADKYDSQDKTVQAKKWPLGKLAVIGVLFDTKNYDKDAVSDTTVAAIDKFFDSLLLDKHLVRDSQGRIDKPVLPDLALGELMSTLNTTHRWIYNGSLTTPPCYEFVYWNVLQTVYPIKEKHFNQYKEVLKGRADKKTGAIEKGNNRKTRPPYPYHNLTLVRPPDVFVPKDTEVEHEIMLVIISIFVIAIIYLIAYIIYKKVMARRAEQIKPTEYATQKNESTIYNSTQPDVTTAK